jgi:hypothetical protein
MEQLRIQKASNGESNAGLNPMDGGPEQIQLDGKGVTLAMILGASEIKKGKAHVEKLIQKRTHIHLEGKKLQLVNNM